MTSQPAMPVGPPRLFAYGSIAPGRPNAHILDAVAGTWEPVTTTGQLVHDGWGDALGYPALVLDRDATEIVPGMLLTSDALDTRWDDLDAFEGAAYQRVTIPVITADGTERSTQTYVLTSVGRTPPG